MISSSVFSRRKAMPEKVKFQAHFKLQFTKKLQENSYILKYSCSLYPDMGK